MALTKDDIRTEHDAAMTSLSDHQLAALARINRSYREARFRNCSAKDMMETVFEEEAAERNAAQGAEAAPG